MNILIVNWTWHPSGGDWTYIENLSSVYQKNGHQVIPFSMQHDANFENQYSKYFIKNIDYKNLHKKNKIATGLEVLSKSIYSTDAVNQLKVLLNQVKIGLAHINIIHRYITPSILKVLKENGIPIVWTLHDYTIICPESTFISNGKICEDCKGNKFYKAGLNKCKKQSLFASIAASLENYVNHYLNYYDFVDAFICPSKFHFQKFKEFGFKVDKLHQIYHSYQAKEIKEFLDAEIIKTERFILFVGRLEKIKGVQTLLKAMLNCTDIKLKIVGYGSEENDLKNFVDKHQLSNVSFLGKKNKREVLELLSKAEFLICPSEWYEVLGFTIVEAMLMKKPVIGSKIGAIPETVIHEQTGLLFNVGDSEMLSKHIMRLYQDQQLIQKFGDNAYKHIKQITNSDSYYKNLQRIIPLLHQKEEMVKEN